MDYKFTDGEKTLGWFIGLTILLAALGIVWWCALIISPLLIICWHAEVYCKEKEKEAQNKYYATSDGLLEIFKRSNPSSASINLAQKEYEEYLEAKKNSGRAERECMYKIENHRCEEE